MDQSSHFFRSPRLPVRLVLVSSSEQVHGVLRSIFAHSNWRLDSTFSCEEAVAQLRGNAAAVVICDRELPDGNWRRLLEATESLPLPPKVIVMSNQADESLWAEVLRHGGYDLLTKPWKSRDILKVVSLALRAWDSAFGPARKFGRSAVSDASPIAATAVHSMAG